MAKYISNDENMNICDKIIKDKIEKIKKPENVIMQVNYVLPTGLRLIPYGDKVEKEIRNYRDEVSKSTEIRYKDHDNYEFHVSVAYIIDEFDEEETKEIDLILEKYNQKLKDKKIIEKLPAPEFVIFNDMMVYFTELDKRI